MPSKLDQSWMIFGPRAEEQLPSGSDPCELLEDFLQQLQKLDAVNQQVQLLLETVRSTTGADLAFVCDTQGKHAVEVVGQRVPEQAWCRVLLQHLLDRASCFPCAPGRSDGYLVWSPSDSDLPLKPAPRSAALVRLSKTRGLWLAAFRFRCEQPFRRSDVNVMRLARRMLAQQSHHQQTFGRLKDALFGLVRSLTAAIDARDAYTWGHSERVARMAVRLAQQIGMAEPEQHDLYLAGLLHDVGKIGIPDAVLLKPGDLTKEERLQIEKHPELGDTILSHVRHFDSLRPAVRGHHERYDGQGYPDRLAGQAIPLHARILAVADSCDALLSDRPYRPRLPATRVNELLQQGAGWQWDPELIAHLMECRDEVYAIHQRGLGDSVARAIDQVVRSEAAIQEGSHSMINLSAAVWPRVASAPSTRGGVPSAVKATPKK